MGGRDCACELRILQQPLADRQRRQRTDCCLRRRERTLRWPPPRCKWTWAAKRSPVGAALWQRQWCWTEQLVVLHCRYKRRGARTLWLFHTCGQKCFGEQRGRSVAVVLRVEESSLRLLCTGATSQRESWKVRNWRVLRADWCA